MTWRVPATRARVAAPAGRGHDLRGKPRIDGQAVLPHEVADPAAQGDAADPDRAGVAEADRQAVLADGGAELDGGEPGLGPDGATREVELDPLHLGQVDHDAAIGRAMAGGAMAAAP